MKSDTYPVPSARANEVVRLVSVIAHEHLSIEADLVGLKWHTYRFQSPMVLNALFRDAYNDRCKARQPRNLEALLSNSGGISPKLNTWVPNGQYTQLHIARQHADRTGMPYDQYIRFCFDFADRRKRGYIPRPNQLRPSAKAQDAWLSVLVEYWTPEHFWLRLVAGPAVPQFTVEQNEDLPAQKTFRCDLQWLGQKPEINKAAFYGNVVLKNRWLRASDINDVRSEVWSRARETAENDQALGDFQAMPAASGANGAGVQTCYGIPGIDTSKTEICANCPVRSQCDQFRSEVCRVLCEKTGSDNPVREQALLKNRERVARSRAEKCTSTASFVACSDTPEGLG